METTDNKIIGFGLTGPGWIYKVEKSNQIFNPPIESGNSIVTGFLPGGIEINPGDILHAEGGKHTVQSVTRRDHRGNFKNPLTAKNAYFTANCTYEQVIVEKK